MQNVVYLIMPVGSDPDFTLKRSLLERVFAQNDLSGYIPPENAENLIFEPDVAVAEMKKAHVIIADLTLERPSCYFEVGLAQGAQLDVHLIASEGTPVHLVGRRDGVTFYDSNDN